MFPEGLSSRLILFVYYSLLLGNLLHFSLFYCIGITPIICIKPSICNCSLNILSTLGAKLKLLRSSKMLKKTVLCKKETGLLQRIKIIQPSIKQHSNSLRIMTQFNQFIRCIFTNSFCLCKSTLNFLTYFSRITFAR